MNGSAALNDLAILVHPAYVLRNLAPLLRPRIPDGRDLVQIVSAASVLHLQRNASTFLLSVNQIPDPLFHNVWDNNTYIDLNYTITRTDIIADKQDTMKDYSLIICGVRV